MAHYRTRIEETLGFEIYQRWVRYSTGQTVIPDPFVFFEKVLVGQEHYPMSRGSFQYWLNRLQIPSQPFQEPYVWRDPVTRAWRLRDIEIAEK